MNATAVAAVLALGLALVTYLPEAEAATSRTLTISTATAHPQVAFKGFDGNPPKLFDMNGDGRMEIIAQNDNQWVYVFDSKTGAILAEVRTTLPAGWGARSFNGPEVAVFDSSGTVRLVVMNSAATVTSFRVDLGASSAGRVALVKEWERRLTDCYGNPGADSKPVLADLDKDGTFEILAATEESGVYALRQNGQLHWRNCMGGGNAEPAVADLDLDGWPDVVYGSDGGVVSALNGRTGAFRWTYRILAHHDLHSASIPVGAGIGQLDGVGGPDIVVGVRDSHDATNLENNHAMLLALSSTGSLLWARQDHSNGNPLSYTHPIVADAAGDGQNEVYWADWNTMGHKPGNWEVTGPGNFYRYDRAGTLVWKQSLATYWSNKDLALADADGDGVQEVLANGPGSGGDGIWYLDSRTGAKEAFVGTHPWKVARAPVVADLWGTGTMQWVVQVGAADSTVSGGGILVYDTHVRYSAVWPHLPYPTLANPSPPPPPPSSTSSTSSSSSTTSPPSGTFSASYTVPSGANEWWVEVAVQANQPIAKVEAKAGSGAFTALAKTDWGTYAKSFHVPAGTPVQFRATSTTGATHLSPTFTWLQSAPPSGSGFDASFRPVAVGNDWWIEVAVAGNQAIAKVEASRDGGAFVALDKQSWGNWAKSLHTPNGTSVVFRATSTTGATDTSAAVTWT